jgi:hypothetical protein
MEKRKNEENQRKQKQKNDEEYEKTVKLLDLINRNKKKNDYQTLYEMTSLGACIEQVQAVKVN